MKPTRLTRLFAQNAMTFKRIDLRLDNQGLVLVRGPNGSGKSATFEVLRHILLGTTARGIKGKELVRAGSSKGYFAQLGIERDEHPYTVQQSIGHAKHGNSTLIYRGEELISHQRAKVRTQKQVSEELLGMTAQQFDSWVFISQEAAHPLVNGTGAECSAYLSESFGLDVYDEMRKKLKDQTKQAESQVGEVRAYEQVLASIRQKQAALGDTDDVEQQITSLQASLEVQKADIEQAQQELLRQRKAKQDAEERQRLIDLIGEDATRTVEDLTVERAGCERRRERITEKLATYRASLKQHQQHDALKERISKLNNELVHLTATAELARDSNAAAEEILDEAAKEIEDLIGEAAPLGKLERVDGLKECPTCGGELDAAHLAKELSKARAAATKLADVRKKSAALKASMVEGQRTIEERRRKTEQITDLRKQLAGMQTEETEDVDVPKLERRSVECGVRCREIDRIVPAMERLAQIPRPKKVVPVDEQVLADLQRRSQQDRETLGDLQGRQRDMGRLISQAEETAKKIERLEQFKHENELRKKLQKALLRLKVRRIHGIVEALAQTLPAYVDTMFGDEDIQVEVSDDDPDSIERYASRPHPAGTGERIRIPLRAMSKGERARLRVAFIWAIRRLMRPERTANILVLDEADGGLDQQGLEAYGGLLEQLRTEYESVFVISHRTELNTVKFDHTWTVVKKDGVSRLEQES